MLRCCSYLQNNQLSGGIPASLGSLTALLALCVRRVHTTPSHPYAAPRLMRALLCGCSDLSNTQLSGAIPASLGSLTRLYYLCVRRVHTVLTRSLR